jgi:hypothetical protein
MVGVVSAITGQAPLVTGKPDPAMHAECVRRTGARRPLVVGDRLDTDIEGARRAGAASLLVLTGVTDPAGLLAAPPQHRPDLLAADAAGLLVPHPPVSRGAAAWRCGTWTAQPAEADDTWLLASDSAPDAGDGLDGLRALCVAHWDRNLNQGAPARIAAVDRTAAAALTGWGLAPAVTGSEQ